MERLKERAGLILLLVLGLYPRLWVISTFPTIPVSDFSSLIVFGLHLRDHGLTSNGWFWQLLNPGLPLVLCGLFTVTPCFAPAAVARAATAIACGLVPILPFVIWRRVWPLWIRILTGVSLAIWPGQVFFSGVVAQDNWVIVPSVALGAVAVRSLRDGKRASPIIAGLLYAGAVSIRQEMLIPLAPLLAAAAALQRQGRWKRATAAALAAGLPMLALAAYRHAATGIFDLRTEHTGVSILGAYVPGATAAGWLDPYPFIASVRPDLLGDREALLRAAPRLALREALHRPIFHGLRILSSVLNSALSGEYADLSWSLSPAVLPAAAAKRGAAMMARLMWPLRFELAAIQALFAAAVIVGIRRRNLSILALATAVLLKYAIHGVTVAQGRYFLVATALELLAISVAVHEVYGMVPADARRMAGRALAAGAACGLALFLAAPRLQAFVESRDVDYQRTYHFTLKFPDRGAALSCVVERGLLDSLILSMDSTQSAALRTLRRDPAPGDSAVARCELTGAGAARPLILQVLDPYAPGGLGGRMIQRVEVDGVEVFSHDIALEPGSGWNNIPLGKVGAGTKRAIVIEVRAVRPDPGADWGFAAPAKFRLARPEADR
jgi:hypothetical protein